MEPAQSTALGTLLTIVVFGGGAAFCVLTVLSGGYRVVLRNGLLERFRDYREALIATRRKMHTNRIAEIQQMRRRLQDYRQAREEERRKILRNLGIDFDDAARDDSVADLENRVNDCNRLVLEKRDTVATFVQVLSNQAEARKTRRGTTKTF